MDKKTRMQFSFRLRNGADPRVIEFANIQSNFSDTVMYLIEKEIAQNGVRNLQKFIPLDRDILDSADIEINVNVTQQEANHFTKYRKAETEINSSKSTAYEYEYEYEDIKEEAVPIIRDAPVEKPSVFEGEPQIKVESQVEKVVVDVAPIAQKIIEQVESSTRKVIPSCYDE